MKYRYREPNEMKDSGVEWLGMIPKEWDVFQLGKIGEFSSSSVDKKIDENNELINLINYLDIYKSKDKKINSKINFMKVSANPNQMISSQVDIGDVLFTPSSETIEDIGHSAVVFEDLNKTLFSYHLVRMKFKRSIDNDFKRFQFNNKFILNQFSSKATGTTRKTLGKQDFKSTITVLPEYSEQKKIATFLDQKTAEFDNIIAKKQAFIEKLTEAKKSLISEVVTGKKKITVDNGKLIVENRKAEDMKDSGVEWLGMIPKEWVVSSLKYYTNIQNGQVNPTLFPYSDMPHIGPENIEKFTGKLLNYNLAKEDGLISGKYLFKKNDVLYGKINPQLGKVTLAKFEGICSADMYAIKVGKKLIANFLFYFMLSNSFFHQSTTFPARAGIPKINREEINSIYIEIPSLEEQKLIVDFLDEKTAKIDNTIERIKVQIEKLKEAKQSLISEAVTGKIEVM